MRFLALLTACAVVAAVDAVDPCKRQPFRGRCPSKNGESPKRSQFVLRYYMRNGECVSYPYGHCASDESEPQLYRYKEECEDACINPPPANLGAPKDEFEQTYGTIGPVVNGVQTDQRNPSSTSTTTQVPSSSAMSEATTTSAIAESTATSTRATTTSEAPSSSPAFSAKDGETARSTTAESAPSKAEVPQKQEEVATKVAPLGSAEAAETSSTITVASTAEKLSTTKSVMTTTTTSKAPITTTTEPPTTPTTTTRRSTYTRTTVRTTTVQADNTSRSSVTRATTTAFPRTECERRRATAASSTIRGGFVPVCTPQGAFEKVQCEPDGRQCFCVDSRGIEIANSRTRNGQKPDCDGIQSSSVPRTKECVGGAVRGPCSATMNRWYYDEQEAKCNRFSYSGCGGNGNNYDSEDACIQRCAPPPMGLPRCEKGEPLKTKLGVTVNCAKSDCPYGYKCSIVQQTSVCCPENNKIIGLQTSASTDVCSLPKERGPCDKYELRFYFNAELKECKYFFWGGCEGNGNNFEKVEECESTCGIAKARENIPTTPRPAQSNRVHSFRTTQGIRITPGTFTRSEEAAVAHESHPTSTSAPSRTATASRRTFTSGATTSSESAATETSTQHTAAAAAVHVAPTRAPPVSEMALLEVNRCLHPKDPGNCRGQFIRWYWDSERKLCDVFTYTGCQGNGNNYASREECLAICHKEATPLVVNDFSTVCKHDVDAGECNGVFQRFAFDTESSECRPFTYGGCGGNGNNFATLAECRIKCQKVALSPGNLCEHDIEVGECSGVFVRFGYDKSNNDCRQFTYGGCGGNGNNFATIQECRNVCVKKVCNPNPQCDLARCQIVNDRNGCPFCSCPPLDQPSPPGAGQCPGVDAEKCIEPCIVINNRKGCKDCVCPTMPGAGSQPPASFDRPVSPPSPHNEDPTPRPALSSARPPASPSNVGPPSGSRRDSADNHLPRQESSITAHSSQRKQIESDSKQLLPPPLSAHLHEKCMQPVEPGPCKHFVDRWFFHAEDGTCHPFKYGGCAGNRNHFFSQNECEIHCARFLRIVSNDGEDGDGDDEGVPRRAAGVTQSHRREPIGVENYPPPLPTLRGVLQTHVAHGKKIAKVPVIHVDSMMSTSSAEAPEDSEVTRTDRPPTITGQRVSRITLRPPTPTEAPSTVSTTTRSTTITTVGTSPTTATQSQDTESTTVASVSQTSNITTEFLLTDTTTPQEVDAQPNTVTVSARTEESAARRVSTVDHTLPEFIRTSETPEIVESTTEAIEEQPQSVHPTRNPVSGTSSSQTDTAAEDTYLRTTTKAPDASTSTSTSSLVADSAAESTTSVDLSVILSTASTLSSTNGRVVTATEASTPEASPSNTGTLASIKAIAPSEATTASTTLGGNVDVDNSILNSTTLSTPLPTKEPHVAATVANSIDHFAKVYKSSENETVEFFDPDDLPPPPPENERRPVMSLAPRIAGEPIKPLKKIEILPKSVITAASPTTTTPLRTTGAPASTSTSSPSAASLEDDLTEIEGLSSFEVSSSEDMAGYSVGREPVPLSPIGIGRNMERLDLDGLEEPTTIIPLVLLASTSVKTDTDAASTATPTAGIQQTTAAATISTERTTTEALTTRAATTTEQKPTSTNAPAATPSTTWSPSTEAPITTPSVPPTTTTLPAPTTQTSTPPTPVATTAATTAPPPRRVLARGETQKGAVEFDARVVCALPPDVGTCFDYVPRWFFNAQSSQCEQFSYGSCGGNENNFADRNVCELKCMSAHTSVLSHVPERCTYERDGGFGKGYNVKWYFNMKNLRCEQFVYEGRGGNDNQFETLSDCERTCSPQPGLSSRVRAQPTVTSGRPPAPEQELRPNTVPAAPLPDKQTIEDILDYDEKLSQFVEDSEAAIPATHTPSVSNSIDSRVIISQAAVAPLPPTPEVVRSPGSQPRPPAVQAARTVVHREKAPEEKLKVATPEKKKEIYKAEPLPEKPPATGNEGLPIVGASPPMSVNYQTGEVKTKASGIRTFQESSSKVVVEDSDLTEGGEHRRDSLSCPNGLQEIRYADGRPVMCLPGKNQCPERSVCFFNGVDFFCCPNEEDPYDKHVFGGYDGEETKHGYKVFGPLNIRRLMDEVPLRVRRNTEAIRRRRQAPSSSTEHVPSSFNIDSITAPLRFDDEKPRQVSRALRMRAKPLPPHHGNPICIEPLSQGDCGAAHLRYFYDREADKCRLFYYSGCKGNSNNFGSLLDCQKLCVLGGQRPRPESASSSPPILRGQCPDGKTPLGGSAPVLCGNTTDSIGCPVGFYCLPGPPDVCCPNSAVESDADKESVRFAPEIPGVPRAHSRQTFLATPKFMCPDASDPLMGSNNEPTTCGAGFDGLKLCPKGFYCAIDVEKQSRMCCPLYGAAERVPTEQVVTPYLGRRPSNPGEVIERGSLPFDQGDLTSRAVNKHEMDEINNRKRAKVPVFETTASPFEDESEETMEDEEDEEDGMAHLMLKPADSSSQRADSSTSPPASVDVHAIDLPTDPPPVEELPAVKEVTDKSVCQIRPSEGRACREDEKPPRTNLHYFYSPKDRRCKLYFYRGCGGNANRFEKKIDCEQLCLP